ncbi:MAG: beta-lactamase family protein [Clostridia bacterium]|nr:beta-lactamase family protein [Clostridia bacterium]
MWEELDRLCERAVDNYLVPSAAVAVGDGDGVYYKKAFGYSRVIMNEDKPDGVFHGPIPENAVKATTDTVYDMASLSKLISTTMVVLRLVEEGEMTLADTVGRYFPDAPEDKRDISVKQLMTHCSGITAHFNLESECAKGFDVPHAVLNYPLKYKAETKVEYTCMGYILLAGMAEVCTGKRLDALADELVFGPLGMKRTGYCPSENPRFEGADIATEEWSPRLERYIKGVVHDENARWSGGISGNAGVFSCLDDLCRFGTMLSRHGEFDGRFLSPRTFELAITDHTPYGPEHRGLGFQLTNGGYSATGDLFAPNSYGHNGFTGTSLYCDRQTGMYVILLTNRVHYTRQNDGLYRFRRTLHNAATACYPRMIIQH